MQSTPNSLDLPQSPTFRPSAVTVAQSPLTLSSSREESRSAPFQKRPIEGYNSHISRSDTNTAAMGPVDAAEIHPSHAADNQSDRPTDRTRFQHQDMDQRSKQGSFVHQQHQSNIRYSTAHDQRQKDHSMDAEDSLGDENERDEDSEENVDELMEEDGDFEEESGYRQGMDPYHNTNSNSNINNNNNNSSSSNHPPSTPSRPGNSSNPDLNGNHKDVSRHQFNGDNVNNNSDGSQQPQTRWEYRPMGSESYGRLKQEEEDPMDNSGDGNGSEEDEGQAEGDEGEGDGEGEPDTATSSGVNNGSSKKRTTPARHKCPQCDKYFTRPFNLKSHQRTHTQERPFVCSFTHCARAFSRLHDCNRHMRTHWRIKPYSCPECHRNFVRQDALTRHLRLDFGHNRCSGYPGPSSGSSAAHGNEARTPSPEDESGHSNDGMVDPSNGGPSMQDNSHGDSNHPSSGFTRSPSPTSPMVISPTTQKPKDSKSSMMMPRSAPNLGPAPTGIHSRIPPREIGAPYPPRESESHPRYPGTSTASAPMSFVHRSNTADRRAITPPGAIKDEVNYHGQHARSYSHSSYAQSQPPSAGPHSPTSTFPPRSGSGPMVIGGPGGSDKRPIAPAVPRHAASWSHQGHQGHELPEMPPGEYPSHGSPHSRQAVDGGPLAAGRYPEGSYAPDQHRPPSRPRLMHSQSDYPAHGHDTKRPSPTSPRSEWGPQRAGPDGVGQWGPEHQQRPQDARMRHPSWSSPSTGRGPPSASYPPDHAAPSSMPPPRTMTMDAWHRNGGSASYPPHENRGEQGNPREMAGNEGPNRSMTRPLSSYGGPPTQYPNDPNGREVLPPSGFPSGHPPPPNSDPVPRSNPNGRRPEAEREPMRRSTTEYDRSRPPVSPWGVGGNGGGDQRSRSFQQDPVEPRGASRHESYGREKGFVSRPFDGPGPPPSNGGPAASGAAPPNERVHPYGAGGMVGVERIPSRTSSYHEREPSRDGMSGKEGGDPREYMPARSYSSMDYETEKRSQERQARYGGGAPLPPKVMTRDLHRRSMSPPSRTPTTAEMSPRYHYSAGSGHGPTDSFGRDEMSSSSFRSVRPPPLHHEPASPRGREEFGRDQGGYFGEAGSRSGPPTPYGSAPYSYPPGSTTYQQQQHQQQRGVAAMYGRRQADGPPPPPPQQQQHHHDPNGIRRDHGSIDMAMVAPLSISTPPGSGGPPMSAKRPPLPSLHNQQVKLEN